MAFLVASGLGDFSRAAPPSGSEAGAATGMPWMPSDDSVVQQNPPDLTWPWASAAAPWQVELRPVGGRWQVVASSRNALSWPTVLTAGDYEWRVRDAKAEAPGPIRRFTVPIGARQFVLPSAAEQLRRAVERQHPRYRITVPSRSEESARFVEQAMSGLRRPIDEDALDYERDVGDAAEFQRGKREAKRAGQLVADQMTASALTIQLGRSPRSVAEGRRRLLEVATWESTGSSGIGGVHGVARDVVWSMALLYDALYSDLSSAERRQVRDRIVERIEGIKREFIDGARMQRQPFNSHGWAGWGGAAAAAALIAGDDARADELFLDLVPPFITLISPWGGTQGGFANGTAYGVWGVAAHVLPFDIIGQTIGVDLYTKPWLANVGRFLAYFLPPGAPAGVFGDGAEMAPERVGFWTMRALAQRTYDPLVGWAAAQAGPQRSGPMPLILVSLAEPLRELPFPTGTPNSILQADIGWAAMHSNLADRRRTSVYFKSSRYGSHNHSHADQNAFVIHAGGRALLKSSGYYDFYGSEHARQWYTTTQAQNAITFDGGKGQTVRSMTANGRIVDSRLTPDHDVVMGDATLAYGGQLSKALRTMVYLRPDVVLIHDRLASQVPRSWEWNFHADQRMQGDARGVRVESGDQAVCIDLLQAPASRFVQRSGFPSAPRSKGKIDYFPDQWHAAFVAIEPSADAEYVVSLRIGCAGAAPKIERDGKGWVASIAGGAGIRRVQLFGERVNVE